jgi:RNA polymerase sigma factor (sigma-70 family)
MHPTDDSAFLREYAENHSDEAFATLVTRHINLVYSVALRSVGDPHQAEEITQGVFNLLAKKAAQLRHDRALSSWLFQATRLTASNFVRSESRRHHREQEAYMQSLLDETGSDVWRQIAPLLDDAVAGLSETDRRAIMLRFYEGRNLREVGAALGASEEAAEKRVNRAVEKLRTFFAKRGVTASSAAVGVVLDANAVQAAPVGLAAAISTAAALAGAAVQTSTVIAATKAIAMTTLQKALFVATLTAAVGAGIYEARQVSRLREEKQKLVSQQEQLTNERDVALSAASANSNELEQLQKSKSDLARLRGEIGMLRRQTKELEKLREANLRLQDSLAKPNQPLQEPEPDPNTALHRQWAIAKLGDAKLLVLGLQMYASDNQGRLPTNFDQTSNYWANAEPQLTGTNQFELVVQGSVKNIPSPSTTIAVREKEATLVAGKWVKAYGFADGHSEYKIEPPEGFEAWEKQHMILQPGQ